MKFNKILFTNFFLLMILNNSFAQTIIKFSPTIRVGFTHRDWGISLVPESFKPRKYNFIYDLVPAGNYLSLDIEQKLFKRKRFILELSNYVTYSVNRKIPINNTFYDYNIERKVKHDHFLSLMYPFSFKKNNVKLIVGGGLGYCNFGTKFYYDRTENYNDPNGNQVITKNASGSFKFFAPKIILGVRKQNLSFFVNAYGTPDHLREPNPTIWLEFKLTYKVFEFK